MKIEKISSQISYKDNIARVKILEDESYYYKTLNKTNLEYIDNPLIIKNYQINNIKRNENKYTLPFVKSISVDKLFFNLSFNSGNRSNSNRNTYSDLRKKLKMY